MDSISDPKGNILQKHAGILLKPKNVLKTVATFVRVASACNEMINQIESSEMGERVEKLEAEFISFAVNQKILLNKPNDSSASQSFRDWPYAVSEYVHRTVEVTVAYDGVYHSDEQRGRELILCVGHACLFADQEIIANKETLELASEIAEMRQGRVIIQAGMAWYSYKVLQECKTSALRVCKLVDRDEIKWNRLSKSWKDHDLGTLNEGLISTPASYSIGPWLGQEVGFLHSDEAEDVLRGQISMLKLQFDTTVISHFRGLKEDDDTLLSFVTGVLPGRILHAGSPVFTRTGTLLGLISDTESYQSDAGRRAVVRSLCGHTRFHKTESLATTG